MTTEATLLEIPGGKALFDWFGHVPSFHDMELLEICLISKRKSTLRIHAWEVRAKSESVVTFVEDKHVVVTITLEEVTRIDLEAFDLVPGIIFDLEITRVADEIELALGRILRRRRHSTGQEGPF